MSLKRKADEISCGQEKTECTMCVRIFIDLYAGTEYIYMLTKYIMENSSRGNIQPIIHPNDGSMEYFQCVFQFMNEFDEMEGVDYKFVTNFVREISARFQS